MGHLRVQRVGERVSLKLFIVCDLMWNDLSKIISRETIQFYGIVKLTFFIGALVSMSIRRGTICGKAQGSMASWHNSNSTRTVWLSFFQVEGEHNWEATNMKTWASSVTHLLEVVKHGRSQSLPLHVSKLNFVWLPIDIMILLILWRC